MKKRAPRLTLEVLRVLEAVLNEAEAGGFIAHTQSMEGGEEGKEAEQFMEAAERASAWLDYQMAKRQRP